MIQIFSSKKIISTFPSVTFCSLWDNIYRSSALKTACNLRFKCTCSQLSKASGLRAGDESKNFIWIKARLKKKTPQKHSSKLTVFRDTERSNQEERTHSTGEPVDD